MTSNQAFDVIEIVAILASSLIFYFAQVRRPCFQNVRLTVLQCSYSEIICAHADGHVTAHWRLDLLT